MEHSSNPDYYNKLVRILKGCLHGCEQAPVREGQVGDERAYFLVQDVLYEGMDDGHVSVNAGISDLAILAFIRATCSRPGALAKDWFVLRCRRH